MKKLIIFGNTVVAKLAHHYFKRDSDYEIIGFTVDKQFMDEDTFLGLPNIEFETIENQYPPSEYDLFLAIGPNKMNDIREQKFKEAKAKGYYLATYISPSAVCNSELGENSLVADNAVVNPFVKIGHNNFIWEFSLICNDCEIHNNCYFSPRSVVSSYTLIKNNSIIGTNAVIKARVIIEEKSLIGANCYISKNTEVKSVFGEKCSPHLGNISDKVNISL